MKTHEMGLEKSNNRINEYIAKKIEDISTQQLRILNETKEIGHTFMKT